ncbi:MAG TPA: HAMP domain-containing sensor histidine kinase [Candidatus Eremiobacteraceae bacterium]|nr:HAMP domain-containing sensor histidine kinase [Candidatus Eremiobacteraceae bacterium]
MASGTRSASDGGAPLPFFSSLRGRMTAWYGGLLALFIIGFAIAVYVDASRIMWNALADRVGGVAQDIESFTRAESNDPFGPVNAVTALSDTSTLDSFVGPGVYVEVYNNAGYRVGKTTDLGDDDLPLEGYAPLHEQRGDEGHWGTINLQVTGPLLVRNSPINTSRAPVLTLLVGASLASVDQEQRNLTIFLLVAVALALGAIVGVSLWLARGAVSPINAIARAAREIGSDDLTKRLNWQGRRDELGQLAAQFDQMLERLEAAFARERRLIADASHELKTPLTVINANAQMLERWGDRDEKVRREGIETIRAESANMARVLNAMLTLAKTDDPSALAMEPIDLAAVVKDAASGLRPSAEQKGLSLTVDAPARAVVMGEPGLLRQLVANLTENAIKFTSTGGVRVGVARLNGAGRIIVGDTGPGIPAEALPHVFERFYRADPARSRTVEGTGLGLAVVRNIVRVHNGVVSVASEPEKGTTFTVDIPLLRGANADVAT